MTPGVYLLQLASVLANGIVTASILGPRHTFLNGSSTLPVLLAVRVLALHVAHLGVVPRHLGHHAVPRLLGLQHARSAIVP